MWVIYKGLIIRQIRSSSFLIQGLSGFDTVHFMPYFNPGRPALFAGLIGPKLHPGCNGIPIFNEWLMALPDNPDRVMKRK
jgi:hypothetical protein